MPRYGHDLIHIQPPVNRRLQDSSSWINMLHDIDTEMPKGWVQVHDIPTINSAKIGQDNNTWKQITDQAAA
jgi:hypothetical protein